MANVTIDLPDANPPHRDDELLVVRCQLGDRAAFEELISRWNSSLWIYVRGMTRRDDVASDVLQEAWLRALGGIGRLRDGNKLRAWLFGIARRVLMDHWRRAHREPVVHAAEMVEPAIDVGEEFQLEDYAAMERALARLPDAEREALTFYYLRSLSLSEVADVVGAPPGTVKSRLHRARRLLREQIEHEGDAR